MTKAEKEIRDFCAHHADWWPSVSQVREIMALAQQQQRPWQGLKAADWAEVGDLPDNFDEGVAWARKKLRDKNT